MRQYDESILKQDSFLLYIYTSMCATCNFSRSILKRIEMTHEKDLFYQMNASYHPEFMQEHKIRSVPCLLIRTKDEERRIYAFQSVPYIYQQLLEHTPELLLA